MKKSLNPLLAALSLCVTLTGLAWSAPNDSPPNLLFIFGDQWRAQAMDYAGDPNLKGMTPHMDSLASQSINFSNAVSGMPVCTPYRASLLTGQYPLTHGLFLNDLTLPGEALTIAEVYQGSGYATGFIGKWHLDGYGRRLPIPEERHQGFEYWKVLECSHNYNNSLYYEQNDPTVRKWEGYDAFEQTKDAQAYMTTQAKAGKPFALFLAWGPPHNPYQTAPEEYQKLFDESKIQLRPNVEENDNRARYKKELAGYYAHIAALDKSMGDLMKTLDELGIADNTILVFTSDHGDMIGSHNMQRKQKPWDESIRIPFLIRYPKAYGAQGRKITMPINTPDIMPTLLGLSNIDIPDTVEGRDYSPIIRGEVKPHDQAVLISCVAPFGEWLRNRGGKEYRGVRTERYTYVRDLQGPWLLYDNEVDPYQLTNLIDHPSHAKLRKRLDKKLNKLLKQTRDEFLPGDEYVKRWKYTVDKNGTVPINNKLPQQ